MSLAKISFQQVRKEFQVRGDDGATDRFVALEDITLDVGAGAFLTLVGPSGCGKSTLLDLLGGLTAPTGGAILLEGKPIAGPVAIAASSSSSMRSSPGARRPRTSSSASKSRASAPGTGARRRGTTSTSSACRLSPTVIRRNSPAA